MKKRFTFGFEFSVIHNFFFTRMDREKDASDFIFFGREIIFSKKTCITEWREYNAKRMLNKN